MLSCLMSHAAYEPSRGTFVIRTTRHWIAVRLGCSTRMVSRYIAEIEPIVSVDRRGRGKTIFRMGVIDEKTN